MRILVVGGGGREHAIAAALLADDPTHQLHIAPGNPGTAALGNNLEIAADDIDRLADAVDALAIDLTVVGPELPLVLGLADRLRAEGKVVFGPEQGAARIEASKAFAKDVMTAAGVPCAGSVTFSDVDAALRHIDRHSEPLVVKASGLAAGKGAIVCATRGEAITAVNEMMVKKSFGDAGTTVVIEEFMEGEELSVFAVTNGRDVVLLPAAQDHKRIGAGDTGPNTGGMGAYSPVSIATPGLLARIENEVIIPTLGELDRRGHPYRGVLYAGLMIGPDGTARVIEFNCRFGDPEAQVVLPLISSGLTALLYAAARVEPLPRIAVRDASAVTTVLASAGYPATSSKGDPITIPAELPEGVTVYHAGTALHDDGQLVTAGGRVLAVTAVAPTFAEAQLRSRETAESIVFEGKQFRRDIGWRETARKAR